MFASADEGYKFRDILAIFVRWRMLAVAAFLGVLIPGVAATVLMPPFYEASATLLVNRSIIAPAYSVKAGQTMEAMPVLRNVSREEEVKTVAETMRTRAILENTVRTLNLDLEALNRIRDFRRYVQATFDWTADTAKWLVREAKYALGLATPPSPEEQAFTDYETLLDMVARRIRITPVPDTNVLRASFRSSDPALATSAINAIIAAFVRTQLHADQSSREHFGEELRNVAEELRTAEGALAAFRGQMSAYSIATQRDLLLQAVERLRSDLTQAEALRAQKRAAIDALRERLRAEPQFQRDISKSLIDTEVELAGLTAQLATLRNGLAERRLELGTLNDAEMRLRDLERTVAKAEEAFALRQRNFEQARVTESMAGAQLREVRVVDLASFPLTPIRPRTLIYLGVVLGAAILAAIALPFVAHLNDTTLASERDVSRLLDVPFVASVPRLRGMPTGLSRVSARF